MSATTAISITDWMIVREQVMGKLKSAGSQSGKHLEMAEALMLAGYIDADAVLKPIREREAREAQRLADAEAAKNAPTKSTVELRGSR